MMTLEVAPAEAPRSMWEADRGRARCLQGARQPPSLRHVVALLFAISSISSISSVQIHAADDFQSAGSSPAPACFRPSSVDRAADMCEILDGRERGTAELQTGHGDGCVETDGATESDGNDRWSDSATGESDPSHVQVRKEPWSVDDENMATEIPDWATVLASVDAAGDAAPAAGTGSAFVEAEWHAHGLNLNEVSGEDAGARKGGKRLWGSRRWLADKETRKRRRANAPRGTLGDSSQFLVSDFARSQMIKMGYDFEKGQVDSASPPSAAPPVAPVSTPSRRHPRVLTLLPIRTHPSLSGPPHPHHPSRRASDEEDRESERP